MYGYPDVYVKVKAGEGADVNVPVEDAPCEWGGHTKHVGSLVGQDVTTQPRTDLGEVFRKGGSLSASYPTATIADQLRSV